MNFSTETGGRAVSFCVDNADQALRAAGLAPSESFRFTIHLTTVEVRGLFRASKKFEVA